MTLRIESLFGHASVQGSPVLGRRAFGVPPGGAFDRRAWGLANALLGNPPDAPVLELAMASFRLAAETEITLAWVGAGALDAVVRLAPGETLRGEAPREGCRSVVALPGGVDRVEGRLRAREARLGSPRRLAGEPLGGGGELRVVRGPQADRLDFDAFLAGESRVSLASDRVGVRLIGNPLPHALELPSEPACPGVVQVPPGGEPIVLGPDGPTIGGYPKIAVVIDADRETIAQLRPGDPVHWREVTLGEARELGREAQRRRERAQRLVGLGIRS